MTESGVYAVKPPGSVVDEHHTPLGSHDEAASFVQPVTEEGTVVLRSAVAGAIGGIAGTLAMNYAQRAWTVAVDGRAPTSAADEHDARDWQERDEHQNANELAAQAVAMATVQRRLTPSELPIAARLVHFAFGAAVGAAYGVAVGDDDSAHPRTGVLLGVTLWILADEIAMPMIGLSRPTIERPLEMHLQSFAAHVVYGVTTERVRHLAYEAI